MLLVLNQVLVIVHLNFIWVRIYFKIGLHVECCLLSSIGPGGVNLKRDRIVPVSVKFHRSVQRNCAISSGFN